MRKTIDWGNDNSFIDNYAKLQSSRKMATLYHCDKKSVLNHAKKIGLDVTQFIPSVDNETKQLIIDSYEDKTSRELSKELNIPRGTITKIWHDSNLKGKHHKGHVRCNIQGQRFGKLNVLSQTNERSKHGDIIWECQCDCGNMVKYPSSWLTSHAVVSCGCVGKQNLELGRGRFSDETGKVYGKLTVLNRCENAKIQSGAEVVQWLCRCECGRLTKVHIQNLKNGNTKSCGFCNKKSIGESKIEELLKQHNIPFVREKRFDDCKYRNKLSFDFYINNSYCLEYDGRFHFDNNTMYNYEYTKIRDEIKNNYCITHNIPLIRIPYTHLKNITIDDLLLETSTFIYSNADIKSGKIGESWNANTEITE